MPKARTAPHVRAHAARSAPHARARRRAYCRARAPPRPALRPGDRGDVATAAGALRRRSLGAALARGLALPPPRGARLRDECARLGPRGIGGGRRSAAENGRRDRHQIWGLSPTPAGSSCTRWLPERGCALALRAVHPPAGQPVRPPARPHVARERARARHHPHVRALAARARRRRARRRGMRLREGAVRHARCRAAPVRAACVRAARARARAVWSAPSPGTWARGSQLSA